MNNLRGVYIIWYRDLLRFWHEKMRVIGSLTFPLLFLFVFGSGLGNRVGFLGPEVDYAQFMFPGIIGMTVLISSFSAGISVTWDRELGFLKEVLVAPISRASVAMGKTLGAATVALLQGIAILIFAPLIGVTPSIWTVLALLPLMLLLAASMGSLGIMLAAHVRSMESYTAVTQLLMFPMVFLSGAFFPLEGLPVWMNILVKFNPATYGIAPIRQVILGVPSDSHFNISLLGHTMSLWDNVAVLAIFGAVMTILAMWSFGAQE
jgi:ABC-2 type transport system permease protein